MSAKGFLFELAMKQAVERGYKFDPVGKYAPWTDDDYTQLSALSDLRRIGYGLRNLIVQKRASGQPFDNEEGLLRHVHAMCRAQFEAWQSTERQRRMPH